MAERKEEKTKSVCEKCGGAGFILTEKGAVPCECRADQLLRMRLASASIPPRYKNKSIDTFKGNDKKRKALRNEARAYVKSFKPRRKSEIKQGLLFIGCTGCGKTHLSVGILNAVIQKGNTGYFCNVVDFFMRLRDTYYGDTNYDEKDMIDKVNSVDLLVLDDLGAEKPSEWIRDRLYTLVNRRYESNLPILVTTNKRDVEELSDHVGERVVSRLCEMCAVLDNFPNEDYRMKGLDLQLDRVRK